MSSQQYKIIDINKSNVEKYDFFCCKSKKESEGYQNKLKWIKSRFKEGLKLKLLLVDEGTKKGLTSRGFIEYIPGEYCWRGIQANGYMVIHCLWVVGKQKKKGYGTKLLEECLNDAKGMNGVAVVTTKQTWMVKSKIFIKNGFEKVDTAVDKDLELYVKQFSKNASLPKFNTTSLKEKRENNSGFTIFKSDQCPYVPDAIEMVKNVLKETKIPVQVESVTTSNEAQNGAHPFGSFCITLNKELVTYRISTAAQFRKLLNEKGIAKL